MEKQILLGKRNQLEVLREVDFGLYLGAGEIGDILLPRRYVPKGTKVGDVLDVFLYLDSEERLVATTEQPLIEVGQFACLQVKWVNEFGAFLDWGLMKDLFCPFREQKMRMEQGKRYVVFCYIDRQTYRIVASAKIERFLKEDTPTYQPGDEVDVLLCQRTDLGMKAIVDSNYLGMFFSNEIFRPLHMGDRFTAYVKQVREDGKIDLQLQSHVGQQRVMDFSEQLLNHLLTVPGGFCPLHDKSEAADIYAQFGVSKKTFKRGVGDLYKRQYITLEDNGIRLTPLGQSMAED